MGESGRDELGVRRFEPCQLAEQAVILSVGDRRAIEDVIEIVVPANLRSQPIDAATYDIQTSLPCHGKLRPRRGWDVCSRL